MFDSPVYWWEAGAAWNVRRFLAVDWRRTLTPEIGVSRLLEVYRQHDIRLCHQDLIAVADGYGK